MSIIAGGRVALIAVGVFAGALGVGLAGTPSVAAPAQSESVSTTRTVKQVRYHKRYVNRKNVRASQKSSPTPKATEPEVAEAGGAVIIPASVANANAAVITEPTGAAKAMTTRANALLMAGTDTPAEPQAPAAENSQVVAADQLNEVDRTLQEQPANSQTTVALAPTRQVAAVATNAAANDNSTWDQTSLIGKIFIAFGALLTIASAARMFMA